MEFVQGSFTGGELDPSLYGRVDLDRYATSLRTCRNFIVQPHGGIKNRPGTRFVAEVKDSTKKTILIPFEFNNQETYILEFGHLYIRVHTYGAPLLYPATYATVALRGTPVEIPTTYTESMLEQIKFTQSANVMILVHPSVRPKRLERREAYSWQLLDAPFKLGPWQPLNADADKVYEATATVAIPKVIASTGTLGASVTLESDQAIFTTEHKDLLFYMEDENFGEPWEVGKFYAADVTCRSDGKYYRTTSGGTSGTLRPTHESGKWYDGKAGVEWTYIHSGFGVVKLDGVMSESGRKHTGTVKSTIPSTLVGTIGSSAANKTIADAYWIGNDFTLKVNGHGLSSGATISYTINFLDYTGVTKSRSGTAVMTSTGTDYLTIPTTNEMTYEWGFMTFGTGTITSGASGVAGSSTNIWMFGAWGDTPKLGWPSCVGFHQQRLCFASNTGGPQTLWMSRTDAYDDFGMSNPVQADDAITLNIASQQLNAIKALAPMDRLLILTSGGVWLMGNGQEDAVTPSNSGVKLQGYRGSSDMLPLGIGNSMLFVQEKGQVVRDLAYEFQNDSYNTNDMTVMASHLLKGHTITDWAYQAHPFSIVWAVRDDGVLLGMTYLREQKVVAWHQHDTDGLFESVACVSETDVDGLYVIVNRTINGTTKRYIERFADRQNEDFYVDCGAEFTPTASSSTPITDELYITNEAWRILKGNPQFYPADQTNTTNLTLSSPTYDFTGTEGDTLYFYDASGSEVYTVTIVTVPSAHLATITVDKYIPAAWVTQTWTIGDIAYVEAGSPITQWYWGSSTALGGAGTVTLYYSEVWNPPGAGGTVTQWTLAGSTYTFTSANIGNTVVVSIGGVRYELVILGGAGENPGILVEANYAYPSAQLGVAQSNWGFGSGSVTVPWLKNATVWTVGTNLEASAVVNATSGVVTVGTEPTYQVGLPYLCDMETLDINSTQANLRSKQKLITGVQFLIDESRTLYAGNTFTNLFETAIDTVDEYNASTGVMSGVGSVVIQGQWSRNGRVCVRHSDPRAMSILAAIPEVSIGS